MRLPYHDFGAVLLIPDRGIQLGGRQKLIHVSCMALIVQMPLFRGHREHLRVLSLQEHLLGPALQIYSLRIVRHTCLSIEVLIFSQLFQERIAIIRRVFLVE